MKSRPRRRARFSCSPAAPPTCANAMTANAEPSWLARGLRQTRDRLDDDASGPRAPGPRRLPDGPGRTARPCPAAAACRSTSVSAPRLPLSWNTRQDGHHLGRPRPPRNNSSMRRSGCARMMSSSTSEFKLGADPPPARPAPALLALDELQEPLVQAGGGHGELLHPRMIGDCFPAFQWGASRRPTGRLTRAPGRVATGGRPPGTARG